MVFLVLIFFLYNQRKIQAQLFFKINFCKWDIHPNFDGFYGVYVFLLISAEDDNGCEIIVRGASAENVQRNVENVVKEVDS